MKPSPCTPPHLELFDDMKNATEDIQSKRSQYNKQTKQNKINKQPNLRYEFFLKDYHISSLTFVH